MRFIVKATIPVEAGNALVRDPNFGKKMEDILADLKPDAVYYTLENGQRTICFVLQIADVSQFPAIFEPLWLALKAGIECLPAMDQAEFAKAVPAIERAAKKY